MTSYRQTLVEMRHRFDKRPEKEVEHPEYRVWQCSNCRRWTSVKVEDVASYVDAEAYADMIDEGKWPRGCAGNADPGPQVDSGIEGLPDDVVAQWKDA